MGRTVVNKVRPTRAALAALTSNGKKQKWAVDGVKGLSVQMSPHGFKQWCVRYKDPQGRIREMALTPFEAFPPDRAIAEAARIRAMAKLEQRDPLAERAARQPAPVAPERPAEAELDTLAARYFAACEAGLDRIARRFPKTPHTIKNERICWRLHLEPAMRGRTPAEITHRDALAILTHLVAHAGRGVAGKSHNVARNMFGFAMREGLIGANPFAGLGQIGNAPRDVMASDDDLRRLWRMTDAYQNPTDPRRFEGRSVARVVQIAILTGQRRGEVVRMRRADLDLEAALWTIPARDRKERRRNEIPLSGFAMEIIARALADSAGDSAHGTAPAAFVFASPRSGEALSPDSVTRWLVRRRAEAARAGQSFSADFTVHDLRRTVRTIMTDDHRLAVGAITDEATAERVLNHRTGGVLAATYDHSRRLRTKRAALEGLAQEIRRIVYGGEPG